jgi:hypothetical protein
LALASANKAEEQRACPNIKIMALDHAKFEKVNKLEAIKDICTTEE